MVLGPKGRLGAKVCVKSVIILRYSIFLPFIHHTITKVRFASLFSGGFTTMAVINPPERKLTKSTSVQWGEITFYFLRKVPILRRILFKEHS